MTITVDGKPLKEYVDQQEGAEIEAVRKSEAGVRTRQPIITKHNGNISGTQTSKVRHIYTKGQKETHVIIRGTIFNWEDKAPYVTSGASILGAIELSQSDDTIKCHECGAWTKRISQHCRTHGLSPIEYRSKHGFSRRSSLVSPGEHEILSDRALTHLCRSSGSVSPKRPTVTATMRRPVDSYEKRNLKNQCRAQLEKRLLALAAMRLVVACVGRSPPLD